MRISDWSSDVCSSDLDIGLRPAGEIEIGTGRQEFEACLGERGAFLAYQPLVELFLKAVQIANIGCGLILLRIGQHRRAPVGRLLRSDARRLGQDSVSPSSDMWSPSTEKKK